MKNHLKTELANKFSDCNLKMVLVFSSQISENECKKYVLISLTKFASRNKQLLILDINIVKEHAFRAGDFVIMVEEMKTTKIIRASQE